MREINTNFANNNYFCPLFFIPADNTGFILTEI